MYVDGFNQTTGDTAVLQSQMMSPTNNDHCFTFVYKLDKGMSLDFISVGQDGLQTNLRSYNTPAEMTHVEYNIPVAEHPSIYKVGLFGSTPMSNVNAFSSTTLHQGIIAN